MYAMSILFEPFELGRLHIKNRYAVCPMGTLHGPDGGVDEAQKAYIVERARGGFGINDDYVKAVDANGEKSFPCDTVVMATGFKSDSALADSLKAEGLNVYTIGDYNSPRKVVNATCEGYVVIRNLG